MSANNYVDNKRLFAEMSKYYYAYQEAKAAGKEAPKVNNYIGECIYLIATNLASLRKFSGYSYKEEMIGDGIENTLRYLHNFNPEKTNNPFGYFTKIIYYAFLRRIDKEKKQAYTRYKLMEDMVAMNNMVDLPKEDASHFNAIIQVMDLEKLNYMAERYESRLADKKQRVKKAAAKKPSSKEKPDDEGTI